MRHVVVLVGTGNGGHPHEGFASHVGEAGIDSLGLHEGKLEVLLLQGEPKHHLNVGFVVRRLLDTLDEGVAEAFDKLGIDSLVEYTLEGDLDGAEHVGRLVEEVEVFLHHGFVVAYMLVEGCKLADIGQIIAHLLARKKVDLDGLFGMASGLEGLGQLADLLGVEANLLNCGFEGLVGFATVAPQLIGATHVNIKIKVVGILLNALLDQTESIFVLFQLQIGTEKHLVIKLVRGTGIESLITFSSLLKLASRIVMCGQLLLCLLRTAKREKTQQKGQTHQPPLMIQDRCHVHIIQKNTGKRAPVLFL